MAEHEITERNRQRKTTDVSESGERGSRESEAWLRTYAALIKRQGLHFPLTERRKLSSSLHSSSTFDSDSTLSLRALLPSTSRTEHSHSSNACDLCRPQLPSLLRRVTVSPFRHTTPERASDSSSVMTFNLLRANNKACHGSARRSNVSPWWSS